MTNHKTLADLRVERATADLRDEITRLRAQLAVDQATIADLRAELEAVRISHRQLWDSRDQGWTLGRDDEWDRK